MIRPVLFLASVLALVACGQQAPFPESRFEATDALIETMATAIAESDRLSLIADIDHARLGAEVDSVMTPARVLIFSDPELESEVIALNPLAALDFPLRALAFENPESGESRVVFNRFEYLASRYGLTSPEAVALGANYDATLSSVLSGVDETRIAHFESDSMQPDGIITIESPYDFKETVDRVKAAIDSQDDTMYFGEVDFQANAAGLGIDLRDSYMILFGAPGPGGKVMSSAPTLGLDGFCQKFLIWTGEDGVVRLSFNDLIALAERQGAPVAVPLRVVNFRLNSVFEEALAAE